MQKEGRYLEGLSNTKGGCSIARVRNGRPEVWLQLGLEEKVRLPHIERCGVVFKGLEGFLRQA